MNGLFTYDLSDALDPTRFNLLSRALDGKKWDNTHLSTEPKPLPKVVVVAVSFYGSDQMATLVDSLLAQSMPDWRLVVVDNSGDASECLRLEAYTSMDARIRITSPARNVGYFGGARYASTHLRDQPEWLVVSNMDVLLESDALANLCAMTRIPGIGMVGPSIKSTLSGRQQNPYMLRRPSVRSMWRRRLMFENVWIARLLVYVSGNRRTGRRHHGVYGAVQTSRVYAVHGSCMAFSREFFAAGGTLDHAPFLFGEEVNAAEQCLNLGLDVVYEPRVRVWHREHQSTGLWRSRSILLYQREAARWSLRAIQGGSQRLAGKRPSAKCRTKLGD